MAEATVSWPYMEIHMYVSNDKIFLILIEPTVNIKVDSSSVSSRSFSARPSSLADNKTSRKGLLTGSLLLFCSLSRSFAKCWLRCAIIYRRNNHFIVHTIFTTHCILLLPVLPHYVLTAGRGVASCSTESVGKVHRNASLCWRCVLAQHHRD